MKFKHVFTILTMVLAQIVTPITAQNVNIQLRNTGSVLEVWLIPKANYTGLVSSLTFAISWDAAYNVDLTAAGTETVHVPAIPIQVSGSMSQTTITNGSRKYRVYGSGGGSSSIALTNNAAFKIMSVAVPRTGSVPTGAFSISNDAFTDASSFSYYFEMGGVNDYTGTTSSIALTVPIPVELVDFQGIEQNNTAYLTWHTASENGFSHFEVERSTNAKNWTKVSEIKSKGTEGAYFLNDEAAFSQSNTPVYRLKMVDTDGSFKYSNSITVARPDAAKMAIKIYPNPTRNALQLIIESPTESPIMVDIIDATGKVLQQKTLNLLRGANQQVLDVSALPSGIYFLRTSENKTIQFIKL